MATISKLKVGQILYDKHRHKMGNTTMTRWGVWTVVVTEIDPEFKWIKGRWNSNPEQTFYPKSVSRFKVKRPNT